MFRLIFDYVVWRELHAILIPAVDLLLHTIAKEKIKVKTFTT
jgi:hypothetical protein